MQKLIHPSVQSLSRHYFLSITVIFLPQLTAVLLFLNCVCFLKGFRSFFHYIIKSFVLHFDFFIHAVNVQINIVINSFKRFLFSSSSLFFNFPLSVSHTSFFNFSFDSSSFQIFLFLFPLI